MRRKIVITYKGKVNWGAERRILKACDDLGESLRVTFYEPEGKDGKEKDEKGRERV